jgi:hypothetical protein
MDTRKSTFVVAGAVLVTIWGTAWKVASDRAEVELCNARNRSLREEIEANRRYAERMSALDAEKAALDDVYPAHVQILTTKELATDERLLRDIQAMSEASGVRILSVTMEVKR